MIKTLEVLTFASLLQNQSGIFGDNREILRWLKSRFNVKITDGKEAQTITAPYVIFIGTGGTERQLLNQITKLPKPLIILSDSYHNSLAASLEISSWLHNMGIMHQHINFPEKPTPEYLESIAKEIEEYSQIQSAMLSLSNARIGLIGGESDWLISSAIDKESIEKNSGVGFVNISIERVIKYYSESKDEEASSEFTSKLCEDRKPEDVQKAVKLYNALKNICKEENLSALTIKCFDLLVPSGTTACLALSLLNDNGIVAGCEGDIPSLWSMLIAKQFCNTTSFMANPSSIDRSDLSVDFAHCTVPISLSNSYTLPSHFESKMGIGIAANMNLGKYTLFKCGGKNLDKFYLFEGDIIQNTSVVERCRTQIKFKFKTEGEIDQFLQSHLGNHVILIPGHHSSIISKFFNFD